jgi:hypothetical protein
VGDPNWRIGTDNITQRQVKIIGAIQVSAGSWMPIIQLTENVSEFEGQHIDRSSSRKWELRKWELPVLSRFIQITQASSKVAKS